MAAILLYSIDRGRHPVLAPDELLGQPVANSTGAHSNLTDRDEAADQDKGDERQHSGELSPQITI
jgi:hypothetical protein